MTNETAGKMAVVLEEAGFGYDGIAEALGLSLRNLQIFKWEHKESLTPFLRNVRGYVAALASAKLALVLEAINVEVVKELSPEKQGALAKHLSEIALGMDTKPGSVDNRMAVLQQFFIGGKEEKKEGA